MKKSITINEIAKISGFSKATVSRVLNKKTKVNPSTREKVLSVIKEYDYTPSTLARNLSNKTSRMIGVIVPEIDNPFFGSILRTIINLATVDDYTILCYDTNNKAKQDISALKLFKSNQVCAYIYASSFEYGTKQEKLEISNLLKEIKEPLILIDRSIPNQNYDGVFYNNIQAVKDLTNILLAKGITDIAIIGGKTDMGFSRERYAGYEKAMIESGLPIKRSNVIRGDFTQTAAYNLSLKVLQRKRIPDAIITCNNNTTLGFLRALKEIKEKCKDIRLTHLCVDEINSLSNVGYSYNFAHRKTKEMAKQAYNLLIKELKGGRQERQSIVINPLYILDSNLISVGKDLNLDCLLNRDYSIE